LYSGRYDEGYEVLKEKRAAVTRRMGLVSENAKAPRRHSMLKASDTLT
jgi:hypothetical protein